MKKYIQNNLVVVSSRKYIGSGGKELCQNPEKNQLLFHQYPKDEKEAYEIPVERKVEHQSIQYVLSVDIYRMNAF